MKTLPVMAVALTLAGCANPFGKEGYFRDKSGDYTQARVAEPLKLPEDITDPRPMGDSLVIPPITAEHTNLEQQFQAPRPDQRLQHSEGDTYSIQRDGGDQWLLAAKSPSEIWPRILSFLEENDVPVLSKNAKQGYLETDWVDLGLDKERGFIYRTVGRWVGVEDAEPVEDRFRIEVRQGVTAGTTEVHLQHKGRPKADEGDEPAPEPADWDNMEQRSQRLDNGTLSELMLFLIRDDEDSSVSLLAQNLDLGDQVEIVDINGNPTMTIERLSFARAWAAIDQALVKAGLEVTDKNRSGGLFYILADEQGDVVKGEPEKEPGFFARLFGKGKKDEEESTQSTYLIRVSELTGVIQVTVEENINAFAPAEFSQKVLNLIKENMN
ncbi:outer membrane protein assembly factor BamC [Endozoicomonas gorgoniicola]|uniref:Outer membrane protein assembly factor BamC n=1 Tax=Endozoicomonas gorgoniicola TaxID=1234144 RepID=A0ABT3MVV2_9GAMM|nr:outer membrane protein assembly factor BamC [Endozoicomonas gorgoniicola]MCW7553480.1 outer membrane protein assembly factor BamC [Endozoicomonas gorgoniicola]